MPPPQSKGTWMALRTVLIMRTLISRSAHCPHLNKLTCLSISPAKAVLAAKLLVFGDGRGIVADVRSGWQPTRVDEHITCGQNLHSIIFRMGATITCWPIRKSGLRPEINEKQNAISSRIDLLRCRKQNYRIIASFFWSRWWLRWCWVLWSNFRPPRKKSMQFSVPKLMRCVSRLGHPRINQYRNGFLFQPDAAAGVYQEFHRASWFDCMYSINFFFGKVQQNNGGLVGDFVPICDSSTLHHHLLQRLHRFQRALA